MSAAAPAAGRLHSTKCGQKKEQRGATLAGPGDRGGEEKRRSRSARDLDPGMGSTGGRDVRRRGAAGPPHWPGPFAPTRRLSYSQRAECGGSCTGTAVAASTRGQVGRGPPQSACERMAERAPRAGDGARLLGLALKMGFRMPRRARQRQIEGPEPHRRRQKSRGGLPH